MSAERREVVEGGELGETGLQGSFTGPGSVSGWRLMNPFRMTRNYGQCRGRGQIYQFMVSCPGSFAKLRMRLMP